MTLVFAAIGIEAAQEAAKAINEHMAAWPDSHIDAQEAVEKFRCSHVVGLKAFYGEQDRIFWVPDFDSMLSVSFTFVIECGVARLFYDAFFSESELFPEKDTHRAPLAQKAGAA